MDINVFAIIIEGTLVFEDKNMNVDANYILANNGNLIIGTPEKPILNKITITLHGKR